MAAAFCAHWEYPVRGLVVTRYGHGLRVGEQARGIEVIEAGHPSPDSASVVAGERLLEYARDARHGEQLYWLVSGGGSALASAPLSPLTFEQKRAAANFLIRAGADIREINCVRKHLSGLKGGRLALAARPHAVTSYAISDVPGDDIADIASGPTIPDPTSQADAVAVLRKYAYPDLRDLDQVLSDPAWETPAPGNPTFVNDRSYVIASAATALSAARALLEKRGFDVLYLGDDLDGEAASLGREHAELALRKKREGLRIAILSGGETRVVIKKSGGRGGRNLEYLAGLALTLADAPGIFALAADTDGIDGTGGHAGAVLAPGMLRSARASGIALKDLLAANDCYRFFATSDALLETGPTRTNVNDFRLIVCEP
jgi:glycerate 2-kinase